MFYKIFAEINQDTPIYGIDVNRDSVYIREPEKYGFNDCFSCSKITQNFSSILCNLIPYNKTRELGMLDSKRKYLFAKTLEVIGCSHILFIENKPFISEEVSKIFSSDVYDVDTTFSIETAHKKVVNNSYDLILIDLDNLNPHEVASFVSFCHNFCIKNIHTTIYGLSDNDDEWIFLEKEFTGIKHVQKYPLCQSDIEHMLSIACLRLG